MGLLDSILGNMMGAGGASMQGRGGATSPIVKALMMLLAAKAFQHYRSGSQGGGLGDILGGQGGLGGMLGGQGGGLGGGDARWSRQYPPGRPRGFAGWATRRCWRGRPGRSVR